MNPDRRLRFRGLASLTAGGPPPPAPRCPEGLPGRLQASGNSVCLNPASPQEVHPASSPPRLLPVTGGPKLAARVGGWPTAFCCGSTRGQPVPSFGTQMPHPAVPVGPPRVAALVICLRNYPSPPHPHPHCANPYGKTSGRPHPGLHRVEVPG